MKYSMRTNSPVVVSWLRRLVFISLTMVVLAGCPPQQVNVPDVVGLILTNAKAVIGNAGLSVGNVEEQYSETAPEGEVISQDPAAGAEVDPETAVDLVISSGMEDTGLAKVDGTRLLIDGSEYRAIGINMPHLSQAYNGTWHHWDEIYGTRERMKESIVEALEDAAAHDIAFIRFFAMPGYPKGKAELYDVNREAYWEAMDEVFELCRGHGIRLMPVLGVAGWHWAYGEPAQAHLDPDSRTYQAMREYIHDFVTRYKGDPVVLMWSLQNELFLKADVDMAGNPGLPRGVYPDDFPYEIRETQTQEDTLSFDMILDLYEEWTAYIKSLDPGRLVTSGDAGVRQESVSRRKAVAEALDQGTWPPDYRFRKDTLDEHRAHLVESQAPVDVASIHAYVELEAPGEGDNLAEGLDSIPYQRERVRALHDANQPVLVGEFGQRPFFHEDPSAEPALAAIDMFEEEGVALIAIWVWHFPWQDADWNIPSGASQPALMERIAEFNAKYAH